MSAPHLILAINPGSTSTKIGIFRDDAPVTVDNVTHDDAVLATFPSTVAQKEYRTRFIRAAIDASGVSIGDLSCCVGRGGMLKPLESGTYRVNDRMVRELESGERGGHASNLGAILANDIAAPLGIPAFIVDPVVVDEMEPVARLSGLDGLERESMSHALNMKAVARRHAKASGKNYADMRLVIAHLGTGVSLSVHAGGRMIDVVNPRDEGPFSPERSGSVPALGLARLCFSGGQSYETIERRLFHNGGFYSYLGTRDLRKVVAMIAGGDEKAKLVFDAMAYQIAKYIGAMATVLEGRVDAILLTGGMAHEKTLCGEIEKKVCFIAPVTVYPGEDELQALALGALRVLRGEEKALDYE